MCFKILETNIISELMESNALIRGRHIFCFDTNVLLNNEVTGIGTRDG